MNKPTYVIAGVDGGGSNTRAVVLTSESGTGGMGFAGSSTFGVVTRQATQESINSALRQACSEAGLAGVHLDALYIGLGGVINVYEKTEMRGIIAELGIVDDEFLAIDNDIKPALVGSLAGQAGICLLVGTGSVCFGVDKHGREWRAGGWGEIIDDPGSGYYLGKEALAAMARAYDGRGKSSLLTKHLYAQLGLGNINEIVWRLSKMNRREIAGLARDVTQFARQSDEIALDILNRGIDQLVLMVETVAGNLDFAGQPVPFATTGGVFRAGDFFSDRLLAKISGRVPAILPVKAHYPPVIGSLILAGRIIDTEIVPAELSRLSARIKELA